MAERSFAKEVEKLRLGAGEEFSGEGILAITKALLQCGVGYVGGYQGAPISHLMDVLADAQDILGELGVHYEASAPKRRRRQCSPLQSLSHSRRGNIQIHSRNQCRLRCARQPRIGRRDRRRADHRRRGLWRRLVHHAGAQPRLCDEESGLAARSRPNLPSIVNRSRMFRALRASNTPVMLLVRIRWCHVHGQFTAKDNKRPANDRRRGTGFAPA